jgi:hypothetical protein
MLELARRIALGIDVRDFLELERAFEREKTGAAAEVETSRDLARSRASCSICVSRRLPGRARQAGPE